MVVLYRKRNLSPLLDGDVMNCYACLVSRGQGRHLRSHRNRDGARGIPDGQGFAGAPLDG